MTDERWTLFLPLRQQRVLGPGEMSSVRGLKSKIHLGVLQVKHQQATALMWFQHHVQGHLRDCKSANDSFKAAEFMGWACQNDPLFEKLVPDGSDCTPLYIASGYDRKLKREVITAAVFHVTPSDHYTYFENSDYAEWR